MNYMKAYRGRRDIIPFIPNPTLDGGAWAASQPGRFIAGICFIYWKHIPLILIERDLRI